MVSHPAHFPRLVGDQSRHFALLVEAVEVDGGMADAVVEGGQIAGQLQSPGGAHGVADEALGVVQQGAAAAVAENTLRSASASWVSPLAVPVACVLTMSISAASRPARAGPTACTPPAARDAAARSRGRRCSSRSRPPRRRSSRRGPWPPPAAPARSCSPLRRPRCRCGRRRRAARPWSGRRGGPRPLGCGSWQRCRRCECSPRRRRPGPRRSRPAAASAPLG